MKIWRQGDVVFQRLEKDHELSGEPKTGFIAGQSVEFHSETGKSHTILLGHGSVAIQQDTQDQETLLRLVEPTIVQHPEHSPVTLPAGQYRAFRISDYPQRMPGDQRMQSDQRMHGD